MMQEKNNKVDMPISGLYLEDAGEKQVSKIVKAIEETPWGITTIQLAWAAGPVTYLALQGGYYFGYGKAAPTALFLYFGVYTLISGAIALLVGTFYKALRGHRKEKAHKKFLYVVDKLSNMIFDFSNFRISLLNKTEQKIEAAHIILKNSHALPDAIEVAIIDITNNMQLAKLTKKIDVFRRAGLPVRIDEIVRQIKRQSYYIKKRLTKINSIAAHYLKLRFDGLAPSLKEGIMRSDGFFNRVYLASQSGNLSHMTLQDAEEVLTFIFELINGRKIEILNFHYIGNKGLKEAANSLEKIRNSYRISLATMNYRLERLFSMLVQKKLLSLDDYADVKAANNEIYRIVDLLMKDIVTDQHQHQGDMTEQKYFKWALYVINLYSLAYNSYKKVLVKKKQLNKAINKWKELASFHKDNIKFENNQSGLRLEKILLFLSDKQKIQFSNDIADLIDTTFQFNSADCYDERIIKQFAISLVLEAQKYFNLSSSIVQRGIESTNAANLGSLEPTFSVQAKVGVAAAIVDEVENNISQSAERLARVLIQQYGKRLDNYVINFLHRTYGADKKRLVEISKTTPQDHESMFDSKDTIITMAQPQKSWFIAKQKIRKKLKSS